MRNKNIQIMLADGDGEFEPELNSQYHLEEIRILAAEDLMTTNFACYMDHTFSIFPLQYNLETDKQVLRLKKSDGSSIKFKDINVIKFGDSSKEANVCGSGLSFKINKDTEKWNEEQTSVSFDLNSFTGTAETDPHYPTLKFTATLESDDGRVRVQIIPDPQPYIPDELIKAPEKPVTLKLAQFFTYVDDPTQPFTYSIIKKDVPT